ncbi:MAG: MarR family winged helix-turn-helix transcriptional regulator [Candidatus Binataceae bacterium]
MKETKKIGRECLGARMRMLNRMITAIYDDALSNAGVKTSQFSMLVAISNLEEARPAEVAKLLEMDESTLSRNVERMCAKGWLRLEPDHDRRSHRIKVTGKGMALISKGYAGWEKAQAEVANQLGADGVAALRLIVRKLRT